MNNWASIEQKKRGLFRMLYQAKKRATSHLKLQVVFLWKHVCALWVNTVQVVSLCNAVSEESIQHCIGYFPQKHCLSAIWVNIALAISLCSVGSGRSRQNCRLLSCAELFVDCGSTFTGNFFCNVGSDRSRQHSISYPPLKRWLCAIG